MGRTCVHWSFSFQCQEQLHAISREEIFQGRKREHSSLCLFPSLLLVYSGKRTLPLLFSSHLTWINSWGNSLWLLRSFPYKMDFRSLSKSSFSFYIIICPWSSFRASLASPFLFLLSFSSIFLPLLLSVLFFPLTILLNIFPIPSASPSTFCLFFLWTLSPFPAKEKIICAAILIARRLNTALTRPHILLWRLNPLSLSGLTPSRQRKFRGTVQAVFPVPFAEQKKVILNN